MLILIPFGISHDLIRQNNGGSTASRGSLLAFTKRERSYSIKGAFMYPYHGFQNLLWFLIVGGVAGWLASLLVQGGGMGIVADIVVGILGAFLAGALVDFFNITIWGFWGGFFSWVLGAVILLVVFRAIMGRRVAR